MRIVRQSATATSQVLPDDDSILEMIELPPELVDRLVEIAREKHPLMPVPIALPHLVTGIIDALIGSLEPEKGD